MSLDLKRGQEKYGNSSKEELDLEHDIQAHNSYPGIHEKIENPGSVDEAKWKEAKAAAEKEYGPGHWAAVSYIYKKMGGEFHRKS